MFLQILWVADTDSAWLTQQKSSYCRKGVFGATGGGAGPGRAGMRAAVGTWAAGGGAWPYSTSYSPPHPQVLAPLCLSFHIRGGGAESVAQPPTCLSWARVGTTRCGHSGSAPVRGRGTVFPEGESQSASGQGCNAVLRTVHLSSYGRKPGQPGAWSPHSQLTPGLTSSFSLTSETTP